MVKADELLVSGDVAAARQQLIEEVRANPGDVGVRMFLFQMCALLGEWDRAKAQLDTLAKLDPEARMLAVAYTQCITAEATRAAVFAGTQPAPMLYPVEWGETLAAALQARQQGKAEAEALYAQVFDAAPTTAGTTDAGLEFDWIADADPRLGPVTEAIIAGRYGLMPFCALESLTITPPSDLRDTVWIQAEFGLVEGARVAGFIPLRYPGSEAADDARLVRGTATGWQEDAMGDYPLGHRLFAFSDESEVPVQDLRELSLRNG